MGPTTTQKSTHPDPVCGMGIMEGDAIANEVVDGTIYYFCTATCHARFRRNPKKYAG